jgi:hypothetical protein
VGLILPLMLPAPPRTKTSACLVCANRLVSPGLRLSIDVAIGDADQPPPAPYALIRLMNGAAVHAVGMTDETASSPCQWHILPLPHVIYSLRCTQQFNLTVQVLYEPSCRSSYRAAASPTLPCCWEEQKQIGIEPDKPRATFAADPPLIWLKSR